MPWLAQRPGRGHQGGLHRVIGHGGKFHWRILPGGPLMPDRAGGDHHIVAFHLQSDPTAGAYPHKGIRPQRVQLLHGDDRRGSADPGGTDAHPFPQKRPRIRGEFPVGGYLDRVVEIGGDLLTAARIARQDAVASYVSPAALNMELQRMLMHGAHPPFLALIIPPTRCVCKVYKARPHFVTFCCCFFCLQHIK